jgi:hypothetical protein
MVSQNTSVARKGRGTELAFSAASSQRSSARSPPICNARLKPALCLALRGQSSQLGLHTFEHLERGRVIQPRSFAPCVFLGHVRAILRVV